MTAIIEHLDEVNTENNSKYEEVFIIISSSIEVPHVVD